MAETTALTDPAALLQEALFALEPFENHGFGDEWGEEDFLGYRTMTVGDIKRAAAMAAKLREYLK